MPRALLRHEVFEYIAAKPRTAKLGVVRADGSPLVAPVWVALDDDGESLWFTTGTGTAKGKAIQRDPRVTVCFDDEVPPFSFVIVDGTAEVVPDKALLAHWATVIGGRYMGAEHAEAYGRRNAMPGELLVKVTPTKARGTVDVAGW